MEMATTVKILCLVWLLWMTLLEILHNDNEMLIICLWKPACNSSGLVCLDSVYEKGSEVENSNDSCCLTWEKHGMEAFNTHKGASEMSLHQSIIHLM